MKETDGQPHREKRKGCERVELRLIANCNLILENHTTAQMGTESSIIFLRSATQLRDLISNEYGAATIATDSLDLGNTYC